jgi:hypothetical protein
MTTTATATAPKAPAVPPPSLPPVELQPAELKTLAEGLSDGARKLLARLSERYESGLTLPDDQEAFNELATTTTSNNMALATGIHGVLVRLTPDGQQLADYVGPYLAPAVDPANVPVLQPPDDPAAAQEAKREATEAEHEAEHEAEDKAEKEREAQAAVVVTKK